MARAELVFGVHAVRALVERDPAGVLEVWLQARREPPALRRALSLSAAAGIAVHRVPRETIERMAGPVAHQGVVARYRRSAAAPIVTLDQLLDRTPPPSLIVVLDEVQDPRNLGACMRCAAGAGADAVVVAKRRNAPLTAAAPKGGERRGRTTPAGDRHEPRGCAGADRRGGACGDRSRGGLGRLALRRRPPGAARPRPRRRGARPAPAHPREVRASRLHPAARPGGEPERLGGGGRLPLRSGAPALVRRVGGRCRGADREGMTRSRKDAGPRGNRRRGCECAASGGCGLGRLWSRAAVRGRGSSATWPARCRRPSRHAERGSSGPWKQPAAAPESMEQAVTKAVPGYSADILTPGHDCVRCRCIRLAGR